MSLLNKTIALVHCIIFILYYGIIYNSRVVIRSPKLQNNIWSQGMKSNALKLKPIISKILTNSITRNSLNYDILMYHQRLGHEEITYLAQSDTSVKMAQTLSTMIKGVTIFEYNWPKVKKPNSTCHSHYEQPLWSLWSNPKPQLYLKKAPCSKHTPRWDRARLDTSGKVEQHYLLK